MARGGFPGMGGGNMQQLARQAQKLQQRMTEMQEELDDIIAKRERLEKELQTIKNKKITPNNPETPNHQNYLTI